LIVRWDSALPAEDFDCALLRPSRRVFEPPLVADEDVDSLPSVSDAFEAALSPDTLAFAIRSSRVEIHSSK
jgi:hypothetical protein